MRIAMLREEDVVTNESTISDIAYNLLQIVRAAYKDEHMDRKTFMFILNGVKTIWTDQLHLPVVDFYKGL